MTCNCIGGNPCPCQAGGMVIGRVVFNTPTVLTWPIRGNPEVENMLAKAREHKMTPKEVYDQRVSFIFGMLPEESTTTMEDIKRHLAEMGVVDPEPESRPTGDVRPNE